MIRNNLDCNAGSKEQNCFFAFDNIVGNSDWARRTRRRVVQLSRHRFNTLISGPRGTGKRLVAEALHAHGPRRSAPFVPVNCSRLPGFLFRTQMLGCAYAETTTLGCLRSANGGTLFLENVEGLDLDSQRLLLEVLETSKVQPHQSEEHFLIDVRIIASTACCLEDAVREGRFLPELYSRLCVLPFETKQLSERPLDVLPIAKHMLAKITFESGLPAMEFDETAEYALVSYHWQGNMDEMVAVLEEAVQRSENRVVSAQDLPIEVANGGWPTLAELQQQHIEFTLSRVEGNVFEAAKLLGISEDELRGRID